MINFKIIILTFCLVFIASACNCVNSQQVNSANQTANTERNTSNVNSNNASPDDYEIAKAGAERLNNEPLPQGSKFRTTKPLTREQIREALSRDDLIEESKDGKVGGGKVVHFSHTCNLFVDNKSFYVIYAPMILQLASFARQINRVLIYDEKMQLIHNLNVTDAPLFCDGNRLFFNNSKMSFFYGEPEKEIKGNVLIFSNSAKEIEGRVASLNFYRFGDLIR